MWNTVFAEGAELVVATCSKKNIPHAIVAISLGFEGDRLLLGACQMKTTLRNIQETGKVSVVGHKGKAYYRANGDAALLTSGPLHDIAKKRNRGPPLKTTVVIDLTEVFDLDKVKKVF